MLPRDAARLLYDHGWVNTLNLPKMLATIIAESDLFTHAWHYNDPHPSDPKLKPGDGSTDWGIFQLNDGNKGGLRPDTDANGMPQPVPGGSKSVAEVRAFAMTACDPAKAVLVARDLYDRRGFQPWAAYGGERYKSKLDDATYAQRNMLHVILGVPLG